MPPRTKICYNQDKVMPNRYSVEARDTLAGSDLKQWTFFQARFVFFPCVKCFVVKIGLSSRRLYYNASNTVLFNRLERFNTHNDVRCELAAFLSDWYAHCSCETVTIQINWIWLHQALLLLLSWICKRQKGDIGHRLSIKAGGPSGVTRNIFTSKF